MTSPRSSSRPEADLQVQLVDYLRLMAPSRGFLFFAVPNEGMGEARTGAGIGRMARLKRMGMRPGVADLVFVKDGRAYFLELKRPGGKQSEAQKLFQEDVYWSGSIYGLANTFEGAVKILRGWSIVS
ncbi:putative VRR-NUC domain-containing protein [Gammaproteobacteria bacterium]